MNKANKKLLDFQLQSGNNKIRKDLSKIITNSNVDENNVIDEFKKIISNLNDTIKEERQQRKLEKIEYSDNLKKQNELITELTSIIKLQKNHNNVIVTSINEDKAISNVVEIEDSFQSTVDVTKIKTNIKLKEDKLSGLNSSNLNKLRNMRKKR